MNLKRMDLFFLHDIRCHNVAQPVNIETMFSVYVVIKRQKFYLLAY